MPIRGIVNILREIFAHKTLKDGIQKYLSSYPVAIDKITLATVE